MAWGYEKGFIIEHDPTVKKSIDCKDCCYYDESDRSCMKRPLYLPVDGYNSWKNCDYFELDSSTSNYDAKFNQLESFKRLKKQNNLHSSIWRNIGNQQQSLQQNQELSRIYKQILDSNRVTIWQKKGQSNRCQCGEMLYYSSNIVLNYIDKKKLHQIHIDGKWCKKCETYYVVKTLLVDKIKEEEKEQ